MPGTAGLELMLMNVRGQPIEDDEVQVRLFRADGRVVLDKPKLAFKPPYAAVRIKGVPSVPDVPALFGRVTPSLYHGRKIPHFRLLGGQTKQVPLVLARRPDLWKAVFTAWKALPASFAAFKKVLDRSAGMRLMGPERPVVTFKEFEGARDYDTMETGGRPARVLAKAALLNLRHKLTAMRDPTANDKPWFEYVRRVIEVRRDRVIAEVDPAIVASLRTIDSKIERFGRYEQAGASNHYVNMPHDLFDKVLESGMISIKSADTEGNLQLTLAHATRGDEKVVLLDADIDEKGTFFGHFFEVVGHKLTCDKTHPFDVHELLLTQNIRANLGYELVAR